LRIIYTILTGAILVIFVTPASPAVADQMVGRLSLNGLPPLSYGGSVEISGGPLVARADAAIFAGSGTWLLSLAMPLAILSGVRVGPLVGVNNGFCPATMTSGACASRASGPGGFGISVGLTARWENEQWWVTGCPTVNLIPLPPNPPFMGDGSGPTPQLPRIDLLLPVFGCPPLLEVGYKVTPSLGVALRASVAPIGISWAF
jgi:hypothetical protein